MILVTGASGFIGRHLMNKLVSLYGKEHVVALTSSPIDDCVNLLHNGYDFDDDFFVRNGLANIHSVIHAGAFTPKSGAEANDIQRSNSNILNTTRLITSELPNVKTLIFLSTLDVYGDASPITEDSLVEPASLYGHAKLYCEALVSAWASKKDVKHQILRIGHVYGPGEEKYQKIIPVTMRRLLAGEPLRIYGEGNEIRSFIYISDVMNAILASLELEKYEGPINVVGEEQITIKDLISRLIGISKVDSILEHVPALTKSRDLIFDNQKMKQLLISPKVALDEGLEREWEYMEKNYEAIL
ncbi:NAD-dependent epimerase/dehydratase [Flammeovirgaceae bacterium 311]|nr:NAD-dependent epimerase/dehydratase [Flammeovirgaceae bacterium 311]